MTTRWDRIRREREAPARERLERVLAGEDLTDEMQAEADALEAEDPGIFERLIDDAPVEQIDFEVYGEDRAALADYLDALLPDDRPGPWTRLTCSLSGRTHDTGAELRVQRVHPGRSAWAMMARHKGTPITGVEPAAGDTLAPRRFEVECSGCGHPIRRDPAFVGPSMLAALRHWQEARARGHNMIPRVSWTP